MRQIRRAAVTGLLAAWLAPLGALAESQSSNTSSNCSDGRCTRVESLLVEDERGRRGWTRVERWREDDDRSRREDRRRLRRDRADDDRDDD
ncbi:hypothetical protein [Falsiroseomonas selenitidurans]|uniref:Secreted protein n=1 Tax=Falsiroseomonas selenitidurans TaxID=2716335 RepID=A0ABX1E778_9PROT|nr:hypothetical protein [Falsiroseomonas selenitidurans]NKC32623.1 hypothetical protein [Falsiroseomonas selenitidurans]OYW10676.1 MAG: hypothetical protein B7Z53_00405 [Rhodospirillales bacterium 12-71-4]